MESRPSPTRLSLGTKLFALFLLVALVPAALMTWLDYRSMSELADGLASMNRDALLAAGREQLNQYAAAQARQIERDRTLLELLLRRQAREVELVLAAPAPARPRVVFADAFDDPGRLPAAAAYDDRYFHLDSQGHRIPLAVAFDAPALRLAPGVNARTVSYDIARVAAMGPYFVESHAQHDAASYWRIVSLASGVHAAFPGHGGYPPDYDARTRHWYQAASAAAGLVWTGPLVDVSTRQLTVSVAVPVRYATGKLAGVTAIDVPVSRLMSGYGLPADWIDTGRMVLVQPGDRALELVAQREYRERGADWRAPVATESIESPDSVELVALIADLRAGRNGVRALRHEGQRAFWAFQRIAESLYLLLIVPSQTLSRAGSEAHGYMLSRFADRQRDAVPVILAIVLGAAVIAYLSANAVTAPLHRLARTARALAAGNLHARADLHTGDELEAVGRAFDEMVPKLNERLRMMESLALARAVQQRLLPREPPVVPGLDLYGSAHYCDETGGDYYDFIELGPPEQGRIGIAIGDVSGHGVPSALLMTTVRALLRGYAEQGYEPAALLQALNRAAVRDLEAGQFMTLFYAVVDTGERALTWASAGHAPALVYRHAQDDVIELGAQDIPLGVERDWRYAQQRIDGWHVGDVAMLGTDGIWETRNDAGALFGRERLKDLLRARRGADAAAIAQALFIELNAFRGPRPLTDDVTIVIARAR